MEHNQPSYNEYSDTKWKVFGELELSAGSDGSSIMVDWLKETLLPLNLHQDFQKKILQSAQDVAGRAHVTNERTPFNQVHLVIFIPTLIPANKHTWGFFRTEKIESLQAAGDIPNHAIEFYLYLE